ncbi:MAG: winged helix-turn-helix domain-containing protein, partial [Acidobacteria bacterium]|nr:winged helix-turn-helix domain-containing protein [Acidobacteriota bacterium]
WPLTGTVEIHIDKLRQKIDDDSSDPRWIVTVHRVGYRFTG